MNIISGTGEWDNTRHESDATLGHPEFKRNPHWLDDRKWSRARVSTGDDIAAILFVDVLTVTVLKKSDLIWPREKTLFPGTFSIALIKRPAGQAVAEAVRIDKGMQGERAATTQSSIAFRKTTVLSRVFEECRPSPALPCVKQPVLVSARR